MNEENTEYLHKAYPKLYIEKPYFECQDGWFHIIDRLSQQLENEIESIQKYSEDEDCRPYCIQIKEKYGTLRCYMSVSSSEMDWLISLAENESAVTCEVCGKPGNLNNGPWYSTLCEDHREK